MRRDDQGPHLATYLAGFHNHGDITSAFAQSSHKYTYIYIHNLLFACKMSTKRCEVTKLRIRGRGGATVVQVRRLPRSREITAHSPDQL